MERVRPDALAGFITAVYRRLGLPQGDAALVADSLVQAELWGHPSHGALRTFWYAARLQSGAMTPVTRAEPLADAGALVLLDGGDGVGQVLARSAMDTAIARARAHGIGAVSVRNAGHFGMAMYFTRAAAQAGCIGMLCANASPAMAPWGGRDKRLGTNPWSWAAPAGRHPPFLLDMAMTAVARGKLYAAEARGTPIPEGWAMDAEGRITTDPAAGIAGTILPLAGHKGYGLAMMVDTLAGVLSGSGFGLGVTGPYVPEGRSGAGFFAMAIDIAQLRPLAEFEADMEALVAQLKSVRPAPGVTEILTPGEPEARAEARHRADGLDLPPATLDALRRGAADLGLDCPL